MPHTKHFQKEREKIEGKTMDHSIVSSKALKQ